MWGADAWPLILATWTGHWVGHAARSDHAPPCPGHVHADARGLPVLIVVHECEHTYRVHLGNLLNPSPPSRPTISLHACRNSEIYNFRQVVAEQLPGVHIPSQSDSAIIGYLVQAHGDTNELWNSLDGIFACVVWDEATCEFTIARDPLGICSLYWGKDKDGSIWAASEMKALQHLETLDIFPPVS